MITIFYEGRVKSYVSQDKANKFIGKLLREKVTINKIVNGYCPDAKTDLNIRGFFLNNLFIEFPLNTSAKSAKIYDVVAKERVKFVGTIPIEYEKDEKGFFIRNKLLIPKTYFSKTQMYNLKQEN